MATTKYDKIYQHLKRRIESGEFQSPDLLPSEYTLIEQYSCSRNTIRRAIGALAAQGYVQSVHGKGVQIIYHPLGQSEFTLGQIESFKETAIRHHREWKTTVLTFQFIEADEALSRRTTFPVGTPLYYIQRLRSLENRALILDHNYFRQDIVPGLTPDIASASIYEYIEDFLGQSIVTTKRIVTVERTDELDEQYLDLNDCNCVAVVSNFTYNSDGIMFEYTRSRHQPEHFSFYDQATRSHLPKSD